MNCSNCENPVNEPAKALVLTKGPNEDRIAIICDSCQHNVLTLKIVLARSNGLGEFMFEGYLPVNSVK